MGDIIPNFAIGLSAILQPDNLLFCFIGVAAGTFIGVLPGMGAIAAISILLPVTFYVTPTAALIMLAGIYYGSQYGGSTASILLNLPGTPSTAVACLDGYPMSRQGRAGVALFVSAIASFVGGTLGILVLIGFTPWVADVTLAFAPIDYFAVMLLALVMCATVGQGSPLQGIAMVGVGVLLGLVGTDVETGTVRYTLGLPFLYDGINLVALAMGLFGVSEVIVAMGGVSEISVRRVRFLDMVPTFEDCRRSFWPIIRGFGIGSPLGILPGAGPTIASFISYGVEKRISRDPSRFGSGAVEGVASPEAANNAAAQTGFVPTLGMGIPGDPVMALMLGALMIHGIAPGPGLINEHPELFWGLIASFWLGNIMLLVLNVPLIGIWVRLLTIPLKYLYPAILFLICIGVYTVRNNLNDIFLVFIFGIIGYGLRLVNLSPAPLLIGFVLGPLVEQNLRRALIIARGDPTLFFDRPIAACLLTATVLLLVWAVGGREICRRLFRTFRS